MLNVTILRKGPEDIISDGKQGVLSHIYLSQTYTWRTPGLHKVLDVVTVIPLQQLQKFLPYPPPSTSGVAKRGEGGGAEGTYVPGRGVEGALK